MRRESVQAEQRKRGAMNTELIGSFDGWIDFSLECIEWQRTYSRDLKDSPNLIEYFMQRACHHSIAVMAMEAIGESERQ